MLAPLTHILDRVAAYHPEADLELIHRAYVFGSRMHEGQLRQSGEPYIVHPLGVAEIIAGLRLDPPSVCAALLHDVVEDTLATTEEIRAQFGDEIAFLVDGVTKLSQIRYSSKADRQAENFRKMLVAMSQDIRVLLVKLADRLHNMRTLGAMAESKRERIARETREIYAPLANRLGIHWLKAELEDLCFQHLESEAWQRLSARVDKNRKERERQIAETTKALLSRLAEQGFAVEVSGRIKHLWSIYRKTQAQQVEYEDVYDIVAFRVIVESVADCYATLGVIHSHWTPIPGRFKDYVALPKPNGYQSLHTTVIGTRGDRMEIQIRTKEMHRVAEDGIAAHWSYKEGGKGYDKKDAEKYSWLRQLLEWQQDLKDPAEFLDSVKVDLFADEVYVFTPKGEVKVFPRGATPIDFAYAIHSDIGDKCAGARVNGAIVPLRYKLRNGDTVDILTRPEQHPSKDWLDFVVTSKARAKVRAWVRQEQRARSREIGREMLEGELHRHGLSYVRLTKSDEDLRHVLESTKTTSLDDLLRSIAYDRVTPREVVEVLIPAEPKTPPPDDLRESRVEKFLRRVRGDREGITVSGLEDILVRYGQCCSPLPGDEIVGFITRGRGVTVHRRDCPKALDMDPERKVEVHWDEKAKTEHPVALRVVTADRPGILATISKTFHQNGINISEANCKATDESRAVNTFCFTISDLSRLRTVMRLLAKLDGVHSVDRV
jgi:GTP pyrophosphokinase